MPNFMNKLGGFVTSIISSRETEATANESIDGKEIPSLVEDFHLHLTNAICNGDPTDEILQNLYMLDCPKLEDKYVTLRVKDLLELNNKSLLELRNILSGLSFIVKYARNLIKDPQKRTGQWRNIHFSNACFIKKIKPLNGFEMILEQLGYTEHKDFGLAFPLNQEPNRKVVVSLMADMMLLRKELKEYVLDKHPNEHLFENILPQLTRDEVLAFRLSGLKIEEDSNDGSGQSSIADFDQHHRMASASPNSLHNVNNNNNASHPDVVQIENAGEAQVKEMVSSVWESAPESSAHSDVADSPCIVIDTKPPYSEPETQAIQDLVTSTEVADAVPLASGEGSSSSSKRLVCSVCGEDASLFCADCANKHLCDNCNKNWHKHPSRQNHRTDSISALTSIASDTSVPFVFDPTYGVWAQTSSGHHKISRKQQTFVVDQKSDTRKFEQSQPNVSGLTPMVSGGAPFADSFYGPGHSLRKNSSNQPDDYQILDYQRSQQKPQYHHYPHPMHSLMDSPYRTVKDPNYHYQTQRSMYTQPYSYQGTQPMPQHMMGKPNEVPEYMMQQVKDQENRFPYNHPASRNYVLYGHSQQFVPGHMNSPLKPVGNSMFQSNLPYFNPQENHSNNYRPNYPVAPPVHGSYLSEFGMIDEYNSAYPPASGFSPHQAPKGYNSGSRQQSNLGQGSATGYYQDAMESTDAKFIRRLQQEPDLQKRCSKCETYIEDLDMDLKELETAINEKLLEIDIDEFCESEAFKEMVKRKKAMMKEKKNLESYRSQLGGEIRVKSPAASVIQTMKPQGETSQQIFYPPDIDNTGVALSKQPSQAFVLEGYQKSLSGQPLPKPAHASKAENSGSRAYLENTSLDPGMSSPRTPVENSTEEKYGQLESRHAKEIRQLAKSPLSRIIPAPKQPVSHGLYQNTRWQCEHCTYINEAGSRVCSICDKTSLNPRLLDTSEEGVLPTENFREPSLGDDDPLLNILRDNGMQIYEAPGEDVSDLEVDPDETRVVGGHIAGSQIQVMKEKKRAHREYQKSLEEQNKVLVNPLTSSVVTPAATESQPQGVGARPKDIQGQKTLLASGFAEEFHTPPSSLCQVAIVTKLKETDNKPSSFEDTLARFNEQKVIDTLKAEGLKLAKLVKMADVEGFDIEAVKVALTFCDHVTTPLDWLRAHWKKNVEKVSNMATGMGNSQQCNSVGELTHPEAEEAYVSCHGNIREAAQYCVDKRTALFDHLSSLGEFPREEILQCMFQCQGHQEKSEKLLQSSHLQHFLDRIWAQRETISSSQFTLTDLAGADTCPSISTSVIGHSDFQRMIKDKNIPPERRIRLILVEGSLKSWGRAELVIKLLDSGMESEVITLEDIVEAVRNCQDRQSAIAYLQQGCQLCFTDFPMSKIRSLNFCQCKMCQECLAKNFEVVIREKHVRLWTCPLCSMPDLNDVDVDVASDYLQFLTLLLQPLIDQDIQNLFETKVRDWHLQKDPNFRWCAHCAEGFLAENRVHQLRMTCPYCREKTCFNCKKAWEDQHENITCEQFAQWKIDNDPSNQSVGLAKHLDESGIDCPTCKMRFSLAKGGCMHFKCPNCGHDFCSGCNEPYHRRDFCNKFKGCKNQGFHCHCPRDCFSHLRDWPVERLQGLLRKHNVAFNVSSPDDQQDSKHCPVMEQKEFDMVKRDEKCGKDTVEGQAGLCELHYKEYLVCIINKNKLDPVVLMSKEEIVILASRHEIKLPQQKPSDPLESYNNMLIKIIKEKLPLKR